MLKTNGQQTLLPESTRAGRKSRTFRYEISSFDRNFKNEETHAFRWRFPNSIREVTEVSLVGGVIPEPIVNIAAENTQKQQYSYNKFTLLFGGVQYIIIIPVGFYTPTTLAAALQVALISATATAGWTVSDPATSLTGFTTIASPAAAEFSLLFGTGSFVDQIDIITGAILKINSPALQLGFSPATDFSSLGGSITSPNSVDSFVTSSRIYIYFNYDTSQDLIAYDRGLGRAQPSAIIYFDAVNNNRKYLNQESYSPLIVAKPAPISRIQTLDILFTDFFGNPVNFGGREVNLVLEITILEA